MAKVGSFGAARDRSLQLRNGGEPDTFDFCGQEFRVADEVGAMPLLRFAAAADSGLDTEDMAGLVAMMEMVRDCIHPDDWPRFQKVATEEKAGGELLMEVCQGLYAHIAARPTVRPADSSAGPSPTGNGMSTPVYSAPALSGPVTVQPAQTIPSAGPGYTVSPPGLLAQSPTGS